MLKIVKLLTVAAAAVSAHIIPLEGRAATTHKLCTQLTLPSELQALAETAAVRENPANGNGVTQAPSTGWFSPALAAPIGKMWANGRTLRVKILSTPQATTKVKAKIQEYASKWTEHANIKFQWVTSGDAELRIRVDDSGASNSYVGTDNLLIAQANHTMKLGWLTDSTAENEYSRVIIHEFGHALGCIHEHQSPSAAGIPWNKPAVYAYYLDTQGWSPAQVDTNMFNLVSASSTQYTEFDSSSVMLYSIPASLTTNGFSTPWNTVLSPVDKAYIAKVYPPQAPVHDINTFNTIEIRPSTETSIKEHMKRFTWSTSYSSPPKIALGLNYMDISRATVPRVKTFATDTTTTKTDININTYAGDTTLYAAGATWFRHAASDPDFQSGHWSTQSHHPWNQPQTQTAKQITFDRAYSAPPKVIVWLTQLDMNNNANFRVRALISNITTTGFVLNLDTWSDSTLYVAAATWIAYPANKAGVASGRFTTDDVRPWDKPTLNTQKTISFPANTFTDKTPTVLVGLNMIDTDRYKNIRVSVGATGVSKSGFTWHLDSWADSTTYRAGASYLAFV
ncbi:hypothetical protein QBC35DRAFT_484691 [Podospora australis]|uniref:Peptidase metallopeptidase domain-containing protein n=1 Tax=Podospora australis TaxID=1536484 RepID=A0AAN7AKP0_9PEZI|nr:hypothetical protein QBC35DRAFT_484691 [Podospora australis]